MSLDCQDESDAGRKSLFDIYVAAKTLLKRKNDSSKLKAAISAAVADLLRTYDQVEDSWCYRPLGCASFKGQRIGYRACVDALTALVALGYANHDPGFKCGSTKKGKGQASRYQATPKLIEAALAHGITPQNWHMHFTCAPRPAVMPEPVLLRAKRNYWDKDEGSGNKLPLEPEGEKLDAITTQIDDINRYFADVSITGLRHRGFRRIFNHVPGFDWDAGGRLYSVGSSYQNAPKDERANLRINGERTVEVDLRASHLTILHALHGVPFNPSIDPYLIGDLPRAVVKTWVTMTLGYDRFQAKWSKDAIERCAEKAGIDLLAYDIAEVRRQVLKRHPLLALWPDLKTRWHTLHYRESEVLIASVQRLAREHDVAALPLHDSLIVGASKAKLATEVLASEFKRQLGATPVITMKSCS